MKINDKVKLITNEYGDIPNNPIWGGKYGYIEGIITKITDRVYVSWDNNMENSYEIKDLEVINEINILPNGTKIMFVQNEQEKRNNKVPNGYVSHLMGCKTNGILELKENIGTIIGFEEGFYLVEYIDRKGNIVVLGFDEEKLIPLGYKPEWKKMNIKNYKEIAKIGDKIKIEISGVIAEGIIKKINSNSIEFLNNEFSSGLRGEKGYKYNYPISFDTNFEIEVLTDKKFTKTKKAYVEITKEIGCIYLSIKIPSEVEDLFKSMSKNNIKKSNAWFDKDNIGIDYYAQPEELERKLVEIEKEVYSDFGSGLMRDNYINVAVLRCVGASNGVKIHSEGFDSLSNADLQDYVRRIGLYIKKLWETNITTTKIKSIISFEL